MDHFPPSSLPSAAVIQNGVSVLYRDVLEIAFGFLPLSDLVSIVAVSRHWCEVVAHINGIGVAVLPTSVEHGERILQSRLVRHVSGWTEQLPLSADYLARIADCASSLTFLDCQFAPHPPGITFQFPPRLRSLTIELMRDDPCVTDGLVALTQLRRLCLTSRQSFVNLSFAFLCGLPQLEDFSLRQNMPLDLLPSQMDQLRQLPRLTHVDLQSSLTTEALTRLVRAPLPTCLQSWKTISRSLLYMDDGFAEQLQLLPSLTHLNASRFGRISVLSSWPALQVLEINLASCRCSSAEIVTALQGCTRLTRLGLSSCDLSNDDLALVFPALPALRSLVLEWMFQLTGLSSLALLAPQLKDLVVTHCLHPKLTRTELRHLHGMTRLTKLRIHQSCWLNAGDEAELALLQPPSSVLPQLKSLEFQPSSRTSRAQ